MLPLGVQQWEERGQDVGTSGHEGDSPIPPQVAGKSHPPIHAEDGTQVSGPTSVSAIFTEPAGVPGASFPSEQEGHCRGVPGLCLGFGGQRGSICAFLAFPSP